MRLTPPFNLPAPGRRQWLYCDSSSWQPPVFLLNSRLGRFSAAGFSSGTRVSLTYHRHPLSRSYGVILPSSFSTDHSSTLGFSPRLRVSVYGTVKMHTPLRGFSRRSTPQPFAGSEDPFGIGARLSRGICLPAIAYLLASGRPSPDGSFAPASPLRVVTRTPWYGNFDPFPIAYALRPRLRDRLTRSG